MRQHVRPRYRQKTKKLPRWVGIALVIVWWGLFMGLIFLTDPIRIRDVMFTGMYFPFFLLLFLAVSSTLFTFRHKFWPSLGWAVGISLFLILRLYGWGNIINFLMSLTCLIILEIYWRQGKPKNTPLTELID